MNNDYGNRENGFRRKNNRNNGNVDKLISKVAQAEENLRVLRQYR